MTREISNFDATGFKDPRRVRPLTTAKAGLEVILVEVGICVRDQPEKVHATPLGQLAH